MDAPDEMKIGGEDSDRPRGLEDVDVKAGPELQASTYAYTSDGRISEQDLGDA